MANNLSGQTWFIDTASASVIFSGAVRIKFIEVVGAAAGTQGGDMAIVNDRLGRNIIHSKFQTVLAGELQTFNVENWFDGLIVPTLGAGVTLRIHII